MSRSITTRPLDQALHLIRKNQASFRRDFGRWLQANWSIWLRLEDEAEKIWKTGRRHYSARTIIEFLRHETALQERRVSAPEVAVKINNSYVPDLARLYGLMHMARWDFFECRTMSDGARSRFRANLEDSAEKGRTAGRQTCGLAGFLSPPAGQLLSNNFTEVTMKTDLEKLSQAERSRHLLEVGVEAKEDKWIGPGYAACVPGFGSLVACGSHDTPAAAIRAGFRWLSDGAATAVASKDINRLRRLRLDGSCETEDDGFYDAITGQFLDGSGKPYGWEDRPVEQQLFVLDIPEFDRWITGAGGMGIRDPERWDDSLISGVDNLLIGGWNAAGHYIEPVYKFRDCYVRNYMDGSDWFFLGAGITPLAVG